MRAIHALITGVALAATPAAGERVVLLADGFGDGDYNNDGRRLERVEDRDDRGVAWFKSRGTTGIELNIAHDGVGKESDSGGPGIGGGNALHVEVTRESTRSIGARFPEVELAQTGDALRLRFDVRLPDPPTDAQHDRRFRFGLYHDGGTPLLEDTAEPALTEDDLGYFVQLDIGTPDQTTADIRGNNNRTLLGGPYNQSFGANTDSTSAALSDNAAKRFEFTITCADEGLEGEPADLELALNVDGVNVINRRLSRNNQEPVVEAFNTVYFGTSNVLLAFRLDNIVVEAERDGP